MSEFNLPALDDVADADELAGDPVQPDHGLELTRFTEERDDEMSEVNADE